jgi:hypothetical protein
MSFEVCFRPVAIIAMPDMLFFCGFFIVSSPKYTLETLLKYKMVRYG